MDWNKLLEKNYKKILIILGLFLVIAIILSFKLIMFVMSENNKCLNNPFVYDAQRTYDEGMEITCSCYPVDPEYAIFDFDRFNITFREEIFESELGLDVDIDELTFNKN